MAIDIEKAHVSPHFYERKPLDEPQKLSADSEGDYLENAPPELKRLPKNDVLERLLNKNDDSMRQFWDKLRQAPSIQSQRIGEGVWTTPVLSNFFFPLMGIKHRWDKSDGKMYKASEDESARKTVAEALLKISDERVLNFDVELFFDFARQSELEQLNQMRCLAEKADPNLQQFDIAPVETGLPAGIFHGSAQHLLQALAAYLIQPGCPSAKGASINSRDAKVAFFVGEIAALLKLVFEDDLTVRDLKVMVLTLARNLTGDHITESAVSKLLS